MFDLIDVTSNFPKPSVDLIHWCFGSSSPKAGTFHNVLVDATWIDPKYLNHQAFQVDAGMKNYKKIKLLVRHSDKSSYSII